MSNWWLWIRGLGYMLLVGGGWLAALPSFLLVMENGRLAVGPRAAPFLVVGGAFLVAGALLGIFAGCYLIAKGHGTPFPLDSPKELVMTGPYSRVRNPQAVAMAMMALGEVLLVRSRFLWLLLPLTIIYLEVLVGPWEERQLTRGYGERYLAYKRRVRKWLPRPATSAPEQRHI